jgi:hypothetical protein
VEFSFRRKETVPSTTDPYCPLGTVPRAYEGMEGRKIKIKK